MTDPSQDMLCLQDFDESVADFYRLTRPKMPWGDYGSILIQGMTDCWLQDSRSPNLSRTGPFVPPISFPTFCVVVTEEIRREIESSGMTGFSFTPAIKKVITPIDWHEWDLFSDEPQFYPDGGEPESYVSAAQHSPELAKRMPNLWRLVISPGAAEIRESPGAPANPLDSGEVFIRAGSWKGKDFFGADTTLYNYVSSRARKWLIDRYPAWVAFRPVQTK
jgi:hypothetical protein